MLLNNKCNKCNESSKQDKERQRSLILTIGFVSFVQFVVKTKNMIVVEQQTTFIIKELWGTTKLCTFCGVCQTVMILNFLDRHRSYPSRVINQPCCCLQIRQIWALFVMCCGIGCCDEWGFLKPFFVLYFGLKALLLKGNLHALSVQ